MCLVIVSCVICWGMPRLILSSPHISSHRCLPGWVGERCQLEDPCHSGPCAGRGVCQSSVVAGTARFSCRCPRGFRGEGVGLDESPSQAKMWSVPSSPSPGSSRPRLLPARPLPQQPLCSWCPLLSGVRWPLCLLLSTWLPGSKLSK